MRKILFTFALLAACATTVMAQKKPLTHDVYDRWQSVGATKLSVRGTYTLYEVNPQEGDGILYVRNNKTGITTAVPRGYKAQVTDDERHAVALIKPEFAKTRQAKIKKKKADDMPKDSVAIINLSDMAITKFADVTGFKLSHHNNHCVVFGLAKEKPVTPKPTVDPKQEKKKKKKKKNTEEPKPKPAVSKDAANDIAVYFFASADTMRIKHASAYDVNNGGKWLAYIRKTAKNNHAMQLVDLQSRMTNAVTESLPYMSSPQFSHNGDRFMFYSSKDTVSSGSQHCEVYEYQIDGGLRKVIGTAEASALKDKWGITEKSNLSYSRDGKKIYVGIQPYIAPNDTSKHDFETAEPNIWRYNSDLIPPMFKVGNTYSSKAQIACAVENGTLVQLGNSIFDQIKTSDRGNGIYALSSDATGRMVATQWDYQVPTPLYLVDTRNGKRVKITDGKLRGESIAPDGNHVVWFDLEQKQWMVWSRVTGKTTNLSQKLKVNMFNEDDDHPMLAEPYGGANWTADCKGIVVPDRFDLWYIPVDGSQAVNLTQGKGRKDSIQYRYVSTQNYEDKMGIRNDRPVYLSVFNYRTKEYGYATTDFSGNVRNLVYGPYTYNNFAKADSAETIVMKKGNFNNPMDLYVYNGSLERISNINPQQADYLWGTPELFKWKAFDGTQLDGILYKPENFDENKKYPVMIYFYERRSESLYNYLTPAPSRSTVNIPYFVSNDYIVFVPDIVYKDGHPGESAYNCIVAGAQALAKNKWVDSKRMAIQGQSWGGYQVAYLVTRTDMFAAAGAGAPVSNMTSAYGGIRWGTGISRQFQYEHTQSRIGKDLWSGYDLYIENSPLFKLPNVKTPVLIMHNNADGAVPYYQGIEMFMGLRRLGKPCWLLEYNREAHNLANRKNAKDLSVRLSDFFDYYLKGTPMPDWMKPNTPYMINGKEYTVE